MTSALKLHHIAEHLLCALLADLATRGTLGELACVRHDGCTVASVTGSAGVGPFQTFVPNAKLKPVEIEGSEYLFDGAHEVDILCVSSTAQAFPLEAKLGVARLSASKFSQRFLSPPEFSRHDPPRIKGSMLAILDREPTSRLGRSRLHGAVDSAPQLSQPWGLVIREDTWRHWQANGEPSLRPNAHVFLMDRLVSAFGAPTDFDALVVRVIGASFFDAWGFRAPHV